MVQTCIHPNIDIEFLESQIGQLIEFLEAQYKTKKKPVLKCGIWMGMVPMKESHGLRSMKR